jgi:hypothetical protein
MTVTMAALAPMPRAEGDENGEAENRLPRERAHAHDGVSPDVRQPFAPRGPCHTTSVDGLEVAPGIGEVTEFPESEVAGVALGETAGDEVRGARIEVEGDLVVDRAPNASRPEMDAQGASDAVEAGHRLSPELIRGTLMSASVSVNRRARG